MQYVVVRGLSTPLLAWSSEAAEGLQKSGPGHTAREEVSRHLPQVKGTHSGDTVRRKPLPSGHHRGSMISDQAVFVECAEIGSNGEGRSDLPIPRREEGGLGSPVPFPQKSIEQSRQGGGLRQHSSWPLLRKTAPRCYGILKNSVGRCDATLFPALRFRELCSPSPALLLT